MFNVMAEKWVYAKNNLDYDENNLLRLYDKITENKTSDHASREIIYCNHV